jgi:hypothetical protein
LWWVAHSAGRTAVTLGFFHFEPRRTIPHESHTDRIHMKFVPLSAIDERHDVTHP